MMPGFGRSKFKLRQDIAMADDDGSPVEYQSSAFIQFRTEFNEETRRFAPMTDEQREICDEIHAMIFEAGVELGISITRRIPGETDVRQFPKVATFSLIANEPKNG